MIYLVPHRYMTPPKASGRRTTEDRGWPWHKPCMPPSPSGPQPPWQRRPHHLSYHPENGHHHQRLISSPIYGFTIDLQQLLLFYITKKKVSSSLICVIDHTSTTVNNILDHEHFSLEVCKMYWYIVFPSSPAFTCKFSNLCLIYDIIHAQLLCYIMMNM